MSDTRLNQQGQGTPEDLFAQIVDAGKSALDGAADAYREGFDQVMTVLPTFDELLRQAVSLPGTGVNRAGYLAEALGKTCNAATIRAAIDTTPAKAGVSARQLDKIAKRSIGKDGRRTTAISMAAGLPGGVAAAATIPADLVQFYAHLIHIIQKLTYLYGWGDLVRIDGGEPDTATARALVLLLGVMAGVKEADTLFAQLARRRASGASIEQLREALRSEAVFSSVNDISLALGKRLAHRLTGQVAGKTVPLVGMVISGTISFAGFGDMAKRLHKELKRHGA